ncbi:ABC transporter permease [Halorussus amylolyticus]|uniref:ABC transporter permease n=1 Tax=Halorussus amylolyticus TaxID=1126242 RepID=UPI001EE4DD22|nr:ABC transporter permease [Halorussus amylolyticus]
MKATDDGGDGSPIDDIFTRTSEVPTLTRREKARRTFDRRVYAPMAVLVRDWRALVGGLIIAAFFLTGVVAWVSSSNWWFLDGVVLVATPTVMEGPIFAPPFQDSAYPLGTGVMGKSIFKQLVHAAPAMLQMIFAGAFLSVIAGTVIGTVAGYRGGTIDKTLMSFTDVVLTIPGIALVIVLAAIFEPRHPVVVGIILGIDNWPRLARTVRSEVLSIREEAFTEASRIMGLSQLTILRKDIISNLMPYISINFANGARTIIFESVALYFLGILSFTTLNWGVMMNEAYNGADLTNLGQLHWLFAPMLTIAIVSLGFILFAQGLDRIFNVRLRARHESTTADAEEQ